MTGRWVYRLCTCCHPDGDLAAATLVARVGVSERHLSRLFVEHVGRPPARLIREVPLEAASRLLGTTREPLTTVARRCGFTSAESLRQAFVARFGSPVRSRWPNPRDTGR